ncbi:MAG: NADH-quinone oxidoreductase subunit I [Opitutaceae bacterium]|jgi:NADH-quinone oxidoreductase subunit I
MNAVREIFSGAWSLIVGMRLTLIEFFKPTITVQYPHQTLPMTARYRGHIELTRDPVTGKALCTACKLCERACPSDCILVDGVKLEGEKKKSVTEYHLDFTRCSLCGACVEVCPSDAIQFTKRYNLASATNSYNNMDLVQRFKDQAGKK